MEPTGYDAGPIRKIAASLVLKFAITLIIDDHVIYVAEVVRDFRFIRFAESLDDFRYALSFKVNSRV